MLNDEALQFAQERAYAEGFKAGLNIQLELNEMISEGLDSPISLFHSNVSEDTKSQEDLTCKK